MKYFNYLLLGVITSFHSFYLYGWEPLQSIQIENGELRADQIQLKNDSMPDAGGQGFLQAGFVAGEKAGVWLQVPKGVKRFKTDAFRVLLSNQRSSPSTRLQVFFQMSIAPQPADSIGNQIENAADVTVGPYWNDIPAQGLEGGLSCAKGGEYIGAAIEFTHTGLPSILRDFATMKDPRLNLIFAIPGGWTKSIQLGVQGDWILRAIGHEAQEGECQ